VIEAQGHRHGSKIDQQAQYRCSEAALNFVGVKIGSRREMIESPQAREIFDETRWTTSFQCYRDLAFRASRTDACEHKRDVIKETGSDLV